MIGEKLADYAHRRWSKWMTYLFSKCFEDPDYSGCLIIPKEFVDRWKRQVDTEYKDLSKEEQRSDKVEATEILDTIVKNI